jgi:hypothetical protein
MGSYVAKIRLGVPEVSKKSRQMLRTDGTL